MNKFLAITIVVLVAIVAVAAASGYGMSAGYGQGGYSAPSYGQNYERKTGFKTVSVYQLLCSPSGRPSLLCSH